MNESDLVRALANGPVSGDALARAAGVTRAAIWKRIAALRDSGLAVRATPGQGYSLPREPDLLDRDRIEAAMPADARGLADRIDVAWRLDSTNSELMRGTLPAQGAAILVAEWQSGGRGRRGRAWTSPLGANLYLSVGRRFGGGLARLAGLGLVAGVAVATALRGLGCRALLKWPNDIVVDGRDGGLRKLGGLLVEGGGEHAGPARAVVGVGLNMHMPEGVAAGIDQPWADLAPMLPAAISRNDVAGALLGALLPALARFESEGLAPFLAEYATLDALRSRAVVVHAGRGPVTGEALGLDPDGALRVRLETGGVDVFHAGEVSVRLPGTGQPA